MEYSAFQVAIFDHIIDQVKNISTGNPATNLVVKAVAGSGKTTTIVEAAKRIPLSWKALFLAFNKPVAVELGERLPSHVQAKTLNALGLAMWSQFIRGRDSRSVRVITNGKTNQIMRDLVKSRFATFEEMAVIGDDVRFLVGMAKSYGIVPVGTNNAVCANGHADTDNTWINIMTFYGRVVDYRNFNRILEVVRKVLSITLTMEHDIDFDDMKYFPAVKRFNGHPINAFKFDAVMVDEAQDLNPVDFALLEMSIKKNGLIVGVGDNRQAIYGFRGAGVDSIDKFKAKFNAIELPLSTTYRCAKSIVDVARSIFPEIVAAPNAIAGTVTQHNDYQATIFNPGDMVICRNNAPLIRLAYRLISAKIPVMVKGCDIGTGLIKVINNLKKTNINDMVDALNEWHANQTMIITKKDDHEAELQRLNDVFSCIMLFVGENTDGKVETLKNEINALFSDVKEENKVILSSIHKSKGLESDTVMLLDQHLLYPRWVEKGTWQYEQERNIHYVAVTRAKKTLAYIDTDNFKG